MERFLIDINNLLLSIISYINILTMLEETRRRMKPNIYLKTTPLNEALKLWAEALSTKGLSEPLGYERVAVTQSMGRVTASAVSAQISSPFYHASAMDGYAVRYTETFGASETKAMRLPLGSGAVYVDTGDPVPQGFNAVIMVEDINVIDNEIEFISPVTPWQNVRTVGEDIVASELIAPQSHLIRAVDMGAMLAGGLTEVDVRLRPRIAIIPTGTEIVPPGTDLKAGDIIEFNSTVLGGLVAQWGGEFIRCDIVPDDREKIKEAVKQAAAIADLVVINAGASTGSEDYSESTIKELGELLLHGISIRPGKPAMLGFVDSTPVIGVPGYPVAAHTVFNLFARPLIFKLLSLEDNMTQTLTATLSRQVASALGSDEFVRVKVGKVGGRYIATPLGRGAGLMMSLVRADGTLTIAAMSEGLGAGAEVEIALTRDRAQIENTIVSIGSHDTCMDLLANALKKRHPALSLSSAHVGSMGGLMALKKGEAHLAPTHLLDEATGQYNTPYLKQLLPERAITLITLVNRTQGLMVLAGNPKGIKSLSDLSRDDITFINRQRGSGTRLLLDKTLNELGIDAQNISGYDREEYTHMSVASAVLTGVADTGLGVLSASQALGLDFIAIAPERYDLAIPTELMETELIKALLGIIRDDKEFKETVQSLGGYDVSLMGIEVTE
jgi:putative molybdopterin biosynthesis protein